MNPVEQLHKNAFDVLKQKLFYPIALNQMAERGVDLSTNEKVACAVEMLDDAAAGILSGELAPVPARGINSDGTMSKQASEAIANDYFAFGGYVSEEELMNADPVLRKAAAVETFIVNAQLIAQKLQ